MIIVYLNNGEKSTQIKCMSLQEQSEIMMQERHVKREKIYLLIFVEAVIILSNATLSNHSASNLKDV